MILVSLPEKLLPSFGKRFYKRETVLVKEMEGLVVPACFEAVTRCDVVPSQFQECVLVLCLFLQKPLEEVVEAFITRRLYPPEGIEDEILRFESAFTCIHSLKKISLQLTVVAKLEEAKQQVFNENSQISEAKVEEIGKNLLKKYQLKYSYTPKNNIAGSLVPRIPPRSKNFRVINPQGLEREKIIMEE